MESEGKDYIKFNRFFLIGRRAFRKEVSLSELSYCFIDKKDVGGRGVGN